MRVIVHALISMALLLGNAFAACPHLQAGLKKWSDEATWGSAGKVRFPFVFFFYYRDENVISIFVIIDS